MANTTSEAARAQRAREQIARAALEAVAEGGPLAGVLELLCRTMEDESPDRVIACIHSLNEDATMFCDTAAPSLDESYRKAIDGVRVSSMIGPCCYAAATRQTVVVPDVKADPKWGKFLEFAEPLGLRSCWSKPILSNEGKVLGTFAHFYSEARDPSPRDERMVELLTHAAAVAIERNQAGAALRERNETLEQPVQAETQEHMQIWNVSQDLLRSPIWKVKFSASIRLELPPLAGQKRICWASRTNGSCTRTIGKKPTPKLTTSPRAIKRCSSRTGSVPRTVPTIGSRGQQRRTAGVSMLLGAILPRTNGRKRRCATASEVFVQQSTGYPVSSGYPLGYSCPRIVRRLTPT